MKVLVFGEGTVPARIQRVQSATVETEADLYGAVHEFSGGDFIIVITRPGHEAVALSAARVADPRPKVVLAGGEQLREVASVGNYRSYSLTG